MIKPINVQDFSKFKDYGYKILTNTQKVGRNENNLYLLRAAESADSLSITQFKVPQEKVADLLETKLFNIDQFKIKELFVDKIKKAKQVFLANDNDSILVLSKKSPKGNISVKLSSNKESYRRVFWGEKFEEVIELDGGKKVYFKSPFSNGKNVVDRAGKAEPISVAISEEEFLKAKTDCINTILGKNIKF